MSGLTLALTIAAGLLCVAAVISVYLTNVTARPGAIPRWVVVLSCVALLVSIGAVLSVF
ncbi:hypothetical protein ACTXKH_08915 [Brachybacterium tyrofermentans]|uniref:hypothetical protein n=1 Tax=Brachybacterium tyrofermentans TaxID=47848 RepID=UPI000A1ACF6A|nr:hypothetical protein FM103_04715 [Corynebacterium xerosis]